MIKQLAMCVLQQGVGSMDYILSMMIVMYDGDGGWRTTCTTEYSGSIITIKQQWKTGTCSWLVQMRSLLYHAPGNWNKFCKHKKCVTNTRRFRKLCLDPEFLLLSSRNVGDIRNDPHDNSTRAFKKQAYRSYILDAYGYLGKGNRKVAPHVWWHALEGIIHLQPVYIWYI